MGSKPYLDGRLNGLAKSMTRLIHQVMSNFICVGHLDKKVKSLWYIENDGLRCHEISWF